MILVIFGTTGELIKLAPVLVRLQERDHPYVLVSTGQQVQQIPPFLEQFGLKQPDLWLGHGTDGRDLATNRDIPGWLGNVARSFYGQRGRIRSTLKAGPAQPLLLVLGDTMTTVLAALMGHVLRLPIAHIEGGLRSGDLRNPFPEELNRRITTRLSDIHYAPGRWATPNLKRGIVVDTLSNTVRDSLELVPLDLQPAIDLPASAFGVVSLHRFELLNSRTLLTRTIEGLVEAAESVPLLWVDHTVTSAAITKFGLSAAFEGSRLVRIPRLRFFDFVQIERRCAFVVTDSGGSQQECFYLDRPCLVHRRRTEWMEGLGENIVLSRFDSEVLKEFLADPTRHRRREPLPPNRPADIVVDDLVQRGFSASRSR